MINMMTSYVNEGALSLFLVSYASFAKTNWSFYVWPYIKEAIKQAYSIVL
jgi:hypothetical protein